MSILSNISRLLIYRIAAQVLGVGLVIYFTRNIDPSILGQYFYFESLLLVAGVLASLGFSGAAEKYISSKPDSSRWYSTGLWTSIGMAIVSSLIFIPINNIYGILDRKYTLMFAIALITGRMLSYHLHVLRAELRASTSGLISLFRSGVLFGLAILVLNYTSIENGLIVSTTVARVISLPISVLAINTEISKPDLSAFIEMFGFAKYYIINVVGMKVFYYADVVIIGVILTKSDVAYYEVAWRVILTIITLNSVLANTLFSYVSSYSGSGNLEQVRADTTRVLKYVLLIPFPVFFGSLVIGDELLGLLFTENFTSDSPILPILSFGLVFQSIYYLFSKIVIGIGNPRKAFYATSITVLINIILNVVLISQYGIEGAAAATTISFVLACYIYHMIVKNAIQVEVPKRVLLQQLLAAVVMWLVVFIFNRLLSLPVLLLIAIGGLTYTVVLFMFHETRESIYSFVGQAT